MYFNAKKQDIACGGNWGGDILECQLAELARKPIWLELKFSMLAHKLSSSYSLLNSSTFPFLTCFAIDPSVYTFSNRFCTIIHIVVIYYVHLYL